MYIQCTIEQPPKGILPLDQDFIYLVVEGFHQAGRNKRLPVVITAEFADDG